MHTCVVCFKISKWTDGVGPPISHESYFLVTLLNRPPPQPTMNILLQTTTTIHGENAVE